VKKKEYENLKNVSFSANVFLYYQKCCHLSASPQKPIINQVRRTVYVSHACFILIPQLCLPYILSDKSQVIEHATNKSIYERQYVIGTSSDLYCIVYCLQGMHLDRLRHSWI